VKRRRTVEGLQIDAQLLARLRRWAARFDVPLSRLVTHLLVMSLERLEQSVENVSTLLTEETHGRQETPEGGAHEAR
jgi:hypothetical protein